MATTSNKRRRLQVLLKDEVSTRVKALADERGLSVSAMCSVLINRSLLLPEFNSPEQTAKEIKEKIRNQAVHTALGGGDLTDFKIKALLAIVNELADD